MGNLSFARKGLGIGHSFPAMNPLQILLAILLFGAGATVGGVAGFRYAKYSAVTASPAPRVEAAVPHPGTGVKEVVKTMNLTAADREAVATNATSSGLSLIHISEPTRPY